MRCHSVLLCVLLTFAIKSHVSTADLLPIDEGPDPIDDGFELVDEECPVHCVCSSSDEDTNVVCEGVQQDGGVHKNLVSDLTGQMQGMVTSLEVYNSSIPALKDSFLVGKRNYSLLRTLKLSFCEIEKIDLKAFKTASSLEEVDLSNNDLRGPLHAEIFNQHCPNLVLLRLRNNPRLNFPINKAFLKSESIQEIDLAECGVTHVYQQSFAKLHRLTFINLEHNAIEYIHPEAFSRLAYLEELNLAFNQIINVPQNLPLSVQILSLRGNLDFNVSSLIDLNPGIAINELDISQCSIDKLPVDVFYNLPELIHLNISHNYLTKLYSPFVLRQLQHLDLSHNALSGVLDKNLFTHTSKLETLKLSWNAGLNLPEYGFLGDLTSLYYLDIAGCGMTQIRTAAIDTLTNLAHLNMSHNALTTIPNHIFKPLSHLSILDISFNSLKLIQHTLFEDNAKLRHLLLSHNPDLDGTLKNDLLANNVDLKTLDLSYCNFDNVPESLPQGLRTLNIAGNQIENPNHVLKLVKALPILEKLVIGESQWKCTYSVTILKNTLESKGVEAEDGKSWAEFHNEICDEEAPEPKTASFPFLNRNRGVMSTHFWSILTFLLTFMVCVVIAVGCTVAYRSCKNKVKSKGKKYHTLSESPSASPAPHRIYKETTIPILSSDDKKAKIDEVQPVTFSKSFIFPRFPVTESDLPVSYVEGNYHHDELVP